MTTPFGNGNPPKEKPKKVPERIRQLLPKTTLLADKLAIKLTGKDLDKDIQTLREAMATEQCNLRTFQSNQLAIMQAQNVALQNIELIDWMILEITGNNK